MTEYGSHLLGRRPSPLDERDYKMRTVLDRDELGKPTTDLDHALKAVVASHMTPRVVKRWATMVTAQLDGAPAPTPAPDPAPAGENPWRDADQLDQGNTGHCVGFGWAQYGNTDPINDNFTDDDGHKIYYECKVIDGEPNAEDGSDVRSGAQAMVNRGRIATYVFAENMNDIKDWVDTRGPIVVGTDWMNDMFNPDAQGFVQPTGDVAGGHCYLLVGYGDGVLTFQNSWGTSFGLNGYFKMKEADFATLMANRGEACAAQELVL